jgi:tetratricopeptide (TPR) repeat protein
MYTAQKEGSTRRAVRVAFSLTPPGATMAAVTPSKSLITPAVPSSATSGWAAIGLSLAVILAYWNSLGAPFHFDDVAAVTGNPTIQGGSPLAWLRPPADGSTTTGRPLVNLTFGLNHALNGTTVWGYHAVNLALHVAAGLTLLGIVRRTLATAAMRRYALPKWFALGIALLWALHPLQTETVVNIAQRTESLCGLFYLLTLYGFIRGTESGGRWLAWSVIACLAGMASKEVMVTAPVIVLLYDRTFVSGSFAAAWHARRKYYGSLAGTWLLLAALVLGGSGARGASAGFGLGVSSWSYLLTQCQALTHYLKLSFWPGPLVLDYGTATARSLSEVWLPGLFVVALLGVTIWALQRKPVLGFLGAWFFIILAPSSSFVPLVTQTIAEHRMYLPLAAIVTLAAWSVHRLIGSNARWALALVAVVLASVTVVRNQDYRDPEILWRANVADHPTGARGHNNLAVTLQARGKSSEANKHFGQAVVLQPAYVTAHYNWGVALMEQQQWPAAQVRLNEAVRLAPDHADAHVNLARVLVQAGRANEAIQHYETALRLQPAADVHYNLGVLLADSARTQEAIGHFESALRLQPKFPAAAFALGNTLARTERFAEAASAYRRALDADPSHFAALANLGNSLLAAGRAGEAISIYESALRLHPNDSRLRENLELARAALRNR